MIIGEEKESGKEEIGGVVAAFIAMAVDKGVRRGFSRYSICCSTCSGGVMAARAFSRKASFSALDNFRLPPRDEYEALVEGVDASMWCPFIGVL